VPSPTRLLPSFVLANAVLGESERFPVELRSTSTGESERRSPQTPHRSQRNTGSILSIGIASGTYPLLNHCSSSAMAVETS